MGNFYELMSIRAVKTFEGENKWMKREICSLILSEFQQALLFPKKNQPAQFKALLRFPKKI